MGTDFSTAAGKAVKTVLFFMVFLCSFWYVHNVLLIKRTDGITPMQNLYAQKRNTVDVLFCGCSLMGLGIDQEALWHEYGIAGYNLWGSVQPFWNSYYFLKEALKTQQPKVIALEMSPILYGYEYQDDARQLCNTQGMHLSKNAVQSVWASTQKERHLTVLFSISTFHSRWKEIRADDFMHFPWTKELINNKGSSVRYGTGLSLNPPAVDLTEISEVKMMMPKEEQYLRLFMELCKEYDIPLLLIRAPSNNCVAEQPYCNYVSRLAEAYGANFINTNQFFNQIGFASDDLYDGGHLNTKGSRKLTHYIGSILRDSYGVPDRRGDSDYESWEINAQNMRNAYLKLITDEDERKREEARK